MHKYGLKNWDSILAAIGHGGLKEGQVINKLVEEYDKENRKNLTDQDALNEIEEKNKTKAVEKARSKSGITVRGIHDVSDTLF